MSIKEHRLHVDSSDIDFSLVELKKEQKVFKSKSKNLFEPSGCNYWPVLIFITLLVLIEKFFLKLSTFWAIR